MRFPSIPPHTPVTERYIWVQLYTWGSWGIRALLREDSSDCIWQALGRQPRPSACWQDVPRPVSVLRQEGPAGRLALERPAPHRESLRVQEVANWSNNTSTLLQARVHVD